MVRDLKVCLMKDVLAWLIFSLIVWVLTLLW